MPRGADWAAIRAALEASRERIRQAEAAEERDRAGRLWKLARAEKGLPRIAQPTPTVGRHKRRISLDD